MEDKNFETEVLTRLTRIETKLDDYDSTKTKAEEKSTTAIKNVTKKDEKYNYWAADYVFGKVIVSSPLTAQNAAERVSMGAEYHQ